MIETARTSRINMRINEECLEQLRAAAMVEQQDLSAFVLGSAMDRARKVLLEDRVLKLSPAEVMQLERALERDPVVPKALSDLIASARAFA
jgi:uncharacterized protein (DUF1778 family)